MAKLKEIVNKIKDKANKALTGYTRKEWAESLGYSADKLTGKTVNNIKQELRDGGFVANGAEVRRMLGEHGITNDYDASGIKSALRDARQLGRNFNHEQFMKDHDYLNKYEKSFLTRHFTTHKGGATKGHTLDIVSSGNAPTREQQFQALMNRRQRLTENRRAKKSSNNKAAGSTPETTGESQFSNIVQSVTGKSSTEANEIAQALTGTQGAAREMTSSVAHDGEGAAKTTPTPETPSPEPKTASESTVIPEQEAATLQHQEQQRAETAQAEQAATSARQGQSTAGTTQPSTPSGTPGGQVATTAEAAQQAAAAAKARSQEYANQYYNYKQRVAERVPSKVSESSTPAPENNSSSANQSWQSILREKTGTGIGSEGAIKDAISQIEKGQNALRESIEVVGEGKMTAKNFEELYGFKHNSGTADALAQRYANERAQGGAGIGNYIWGNKVPQIGSGIALAGVAASYLTGDGRRSNAQLYSSPF